MLLPVTAPTLAVIPQLVANDGLWRDRVQGSAAQPRRVTGRLDEAEASSLVRPGGVAIQVVMNPLGGARRDITPFGVSWDSLDLGPLEAFVAQAGDESLTWEAKGTNITRNDVLEGVCGFGNSDLGGFLVLGASRARPGAPWSLDGWEPPDEPALWIENCLGNGGVDPLPVLRGVRENGHQGDDRPRHRPRRPDPGTASRGQRHSSGR